MVPSYVSHQCPVGVKSNIIFAVRCNDITHKWPAESQLFSALVSKMTHEMHLDGLSWQLIFRLPITDIKFGAIFAIGADCSL